MDNLIYILIVEDDPIISLDIRKCLAKIDNVVLLYAYDKFKAFEILKNHNVDLAILDIHLENRFDGIEVAEHIRKNKDFPFVFLTSFADDLTFSKASHCMPTAYIVKPFNRETLISTVKLTIQNNCYNKVHVKVAQIETRTISSIKIKEVLGYINENIHLRITANKLAENAGWDRSYFSRAFKNETGVSPKDYINKKKIEKAIEMMRISNLKLLSISEDLGFESYSSFVSLFKKETGYLPSEFQIGQ